LRKVSWKSRRWRGSRFQFFPREREQPDSFSLCQKERHPLRSAE